MTWKAGSQIAYRFFNRGRISKVVPAIVVEDSGERISCLVLDGTQIKERVRIDGTPISRSLSYLERFGIDWRLADGVWKDESYLWTSVPGAACNIAMIFSGDFSAFHGWYVNLQEPLRRSAIGFDTSDQVLDIWVTPNGEWKWKDLDEFAEALEMGRFSAKEADTIRAEGERVINQIERTEWPFQLVWDEWKPNPTLSVPSLPSSWDTLQRRGNKR